MTIEEYMKLSGSEQIASLIARGVYNCPIESSNRAHELVEELRNDSRRN